MCVADAISRPRALVQDSALAAFTQSASIIDSIVAGINDERLRSVFLSSEAIHEVLKADEHNKS
jgi:hypothetical protein